MIQVTVEMLALALDVCIQNALSFAADRSIKAIDHINQLQDAVGNIQAIASLVITESDTAAVRALRRVILLGNLAATRNAVDAPPHASLCQMALGSSLRKILEGMA